MPDVYRNLPITKTKGLVNGVEVTNEGIKVDMARLEKDYNLKLYENTSLAADRYNSPERNLRGFTPESNLFPTKSGFFRFNVEREFLRNKFPKESLLKNKDYLHYKAIISRSIKDDTKASNAAYEAYLNQRALLNTFNRNAIMNNTDYSYSQKVMDIINEFPHLKVRYPVLNQLAIPNVKSGEKVLTLNNKLSVKGELAESYHQNLLDLANPNIIKVKSTKEGDTEDNKRVSELFSENLLTDRTVIDVMAFTQAAKSIHSSDKTSFEEYARNFIGEYYYIFYVFCHRFYLKKLLL
jgi:hypothetical protein